MKPAKTNQNLNQDQTQIDGIDFSEDDIKNKVSILPLQSGGSNFKTHVLTKKSPSILVYKPSVGMALFAFIFFAIGLGVLFFGILASVSPFKNGTWIMYVVGFLFSVFGIVIFYTSYKPRVFNKQLGLYYKSYKQPIYKSITKDSKNCIRLNQIVAIQIIGEHIKGDKSSYNSFELNLVLKDAKRVNVIDHGSIKAVIADAETLSAFLNVPIWHKNS